MAVVTAIAYDVNNDKDNSHIVCAECADGYDVSTYRIVSQNEANEYGDECDVCKRVLYTD